MNRPPEYLRKRCRSVRPATRSWKKDSGYHRQGTLENAFFRHESILADRLRARTSGAQEAEELIAGNRLNRMFGLGRPVPVAIGR